MDAPASLFVVLEDEEEEMMIVDSSSSSSSSSKFLVCVFVNEYEHTLCYVFIYSLTLV